MIDVTAFRHSEERRYDRLREAEYRRKISRPAVKNRDLSLFKQLLAVILGN